VARGPRVQAPVPQKKKKKKAKDVLYRTRKNPKILWNPKKYYDIGVSNNFILKKTPTVHQRKGKIGRWNYFKLKGFAQQRRATEYRGNP
jgi:hypothetical protein